MRSTVIPRISLSFTALRYTAALVKFSGSGKINGEIWSFFTYLSDVVSGPRHKSSERLCASMRPLAGLEHLCGIGKVMPKYATQILP